MGLGSLLLSLTARRPRQVEPAPLLIELMARPGEGGGWTAGNYPLLHRVTERDSVPFYEIGSGLSSDLIMRLRKVVSETSAALDPREVEPLTFARLVEVLVQRSAGRLASYGTRTRIRELSELAAYEAVGLSRVFALAKDEEVTEFFVDSDTSPVYLDHMAAGRCETDMILTEREREALQTHVDTFSGYTLDFKTPSLKNDLAIGGAILRVSLDLEPVSVNRFALDVRRLNVSSLSLSQLILLSVLSEEAAAVLIGWLEVGGNVTIIGETGTGKTTLLNALDEQLERRLRRLYIEDAVETKDLLELGYHQMKVKVDPFERGDGTGRTKESEIVKALHRSPDIVILSEIQSEEHSRAFFQALASGARGIQTFHASTIEQAMRRWSGMHHIPEQNMLDLGLMVQMSRPERLGQARYVFRVCQVTGDGGTLKLKDLFLRDAEFRLQNVAGPGWPRPPDGTDPVKLHLREKAALEKLKGRS
ncbi:MAG TPA: ATPase, T2SS/T4P/T4SS family [Nitrososphaerales archaeon]|nr:ATPase, T2SS/T4P/T4SS family [Nitrososphaerales archaeon]